MTRSARETQDSNRGAPTRGARLSSACDLPRLSTNPWRRRKSPHTSAPRRMTASLQVLGPRAAMLRRSRSSAKNRFIRTIPSLSSNPSHRRLRRFEDLPALEAASSHDEPIIASSRESDPISRTDSKASAAPVTVESDVHSAAPRGEGVPPPVDTLPEAWEVHETSQREPEPDANLEVAFRRKRGTLRMPHPSRPRSRTLSTCEQRNTTPVEAFAAEAPATEVGARAKGQAAIDGGIATDRLSTARGAGGAARRRKCRLAVEERLARATRTRGCIRTARASSGSATAAGPGAAATVVRAAVVRAAVVCRPATGCRVPSRQRRYSRSSRSILSRSTHRRRSRSRRRLDTPTSRPPGRP